MKITANMVTVARIVLMPIPGYLLYGGYGALIAAFVVIVILGLTDLVDGIMARKEGPTVFGGLIDPVADKIFIAVIYLPLLEREIIPLFMVAAIFVRDFLVTSLRTSMIQRGAYMRTSMLAKYKTAIQMVGAGYIILLVAAPDMLWSWLLMSLLILLPLGLIICRLVLRKTHSLRSFVFLVFIVLGFLIRLFIAEARITIFIYMTIIAAITVISGIRYLLDTGSAFKGKRGGYREIIRFVVEGFITPIIFIMLLGRYNAFGVSAVIILIITVELALGGLNNLLASKKIVSNFKWAVVKSAVQIVCGGAALILAFMDYSKDTPGVICIFVTGACTSIYAVISFMRNRKVWVEI